MVTNEYPQLLHGWGWGLSLVLGDKPHTQPVGRGTEKLLSVLPAMDPGDPAPVLRLQGREESVARIEPQFTRSKF